MQQAHSHTDQGSIQVWNRVVGQCATPSIRMTMMMCCMAHSVHLCVCAVQHWFWGGGCRFGCRHRCGCKEMPGLILALALSA